MGLLEVRVLGPLEVWLDGNPVPLGVGTERALVALLALHAGRPVTTDAIVEALWGEQPRSSAREMVRTYVARVRKHLGEALRRSDGGYELAVSPEAVDALRFERLCAEGHKQASAGEARQAMETLRHALALWRDSPLPELEALGAARNEIAALEELRLAAVETRAESALELGSGAALIPELEGLVRANPYRERLRRALMLALYRSGRQTEALERYREGRSVLIDEVGIEPSRDLQALHKAILDQDPALDLPAHEHRAPSPGETAVGRASPKRRRRRRRRNGILAAAAVGVAALVIVAVRAAQSSPVPRLGRDTLAQLDPSSGAVLQTKPIAGVPGPIAVGDRAVWTGDGENRSVLAVDPHTLRTIGVARLGTFPYQIATDGFQAWAGDGFYGTVTVISRQGAETRPFRPEPHATGRLALAFGDGAFWVGSQDGALTEIDPHTRVSTAVIRGAGDAEALAVGSGSVWVAEANADDLRQVDPVAHRVSASIPIGGVPTQIAVAAGAIWAVTPTEARVWRVDPRSRAVTAAIDVAAQSSFITAVGSKIWVGSPAGILQQLDPAQNAVVRTLQLGVPIGGMAGGNGRLWISVR